MGIRIASRVFSGFMLVALSGCLVDVENQISADEKVDERLIGIWQPVLRSEDEKVEDSPRHDGDIGVNECIIIGQSDDGKLQMTGIDSFQEDGVGFLGQFTGTTRKHGDKRFLLLENRPFPGDEPEKEPDSTGKFVLEYEINDGGDLFLWFLYIDSFEEVHEAHPIAYKKGTTPSFTPMHITATPKELLDFYSDPKVSKLLVSSGKYRRMKLVPGNSKSIKEDDP